MPKYDYRCSAGHQYEKREGFDAPAVQECQECGAQARRVLTPPAIVFKGSGWYINDSRKTNGASSSSSDSSATPSVNDTKTDTKTDSGSSSSTTLSTAAAD